MGQKQWKKFNIFSQFNLNCFVKKPFGKTFIFGFRYV